MDIDAKGKCLTLVGISSVQSYVFASNRLRENAGASYLAWRAMEDWRDNWKEMGASAFLFAGGGDAAMLFDDDTVAKKAIGRWSRDYLNRACGLRLTAAHAVVESTLKAAFAGAEREMERVENAPPQSNELGALPVVRACPSTGLAASDLDKASKNWVSREASGKRQAIEKANRRLQSDFACSGFAFPIELGDLGTREGSSQIAIVHADGNGVGRKRTDIVLHGPDCDQEFAEKLAAFSKQVNESASHAFQAVLNKLGAALPRLKEAEGIEPASKDGSRYFPLRPIVYGGDDLTFVCHGRLGLVLAALYLQEFAYSGDFTACAGVLIMPQKFPFARGYALAEELCISAKRTRNKQRCEGSWMDFHILLEGVTGSLRDLRKSYVAADGRQLIRRPYRLDKWATCENLWREFGKLPRSRAKLLMKMLTRGKDDTQAFLANLPERGNLPDVGDAAMKTSGWDANDLTAYFDPLELLDFHVDSRFLNEEGGETHATA